MVASGVQNTALKKNYVQQQQQTTQPKYKTAHLIPQPTTARGHKTHTLRTGAPPLTPLGATPPDPPFLALRARFFFNCNSICLLTASVCLLARLTATHPPYSSPRDRKTIWRKKYFWPRPLWSPMTLTSEKKHFPELLGQFGKNYFLGHAHFWADDLDLKKNIFLNVWANFAKIIFWPRPLLSPRTLTLKKTFF